MDDENAGIWSFFNYSQFKRIFVNIIKDLEKLIQLFKEQEQINQEEEQKEEKREQDQDQKVSEAKKLKADKKK
jgi:hypothetical protein